MEKIDAGDDFFSGIFSAKQSAEQIKNELVTKIYDGVQIEPNPFAHILMSTAEFPFLISKEVGGGFAFVVASQADSISSNFPMSPFFPVVVQRALFYSAAVKPSANSNIRRAKCRLSLFSRRHQKCRAHFTQRQ